MERLKIISVFGTRPEAIKMAPFIKELEKYDAINSVVCVTAQHRQMLDQVLDIFNIRPHYDLGIMKDRQTLSLITTKSLNSLYSLFNEEKPHIVIVQGDTTTTFTASLAAFYLKIKIGHIEAGLRTHEKYYPYPEEINRRLTGVLGDYHFAPTKLNKNNLKKENINNENIFVTGNTVIDALKTTIKKDYIFSEQKLNMVDFKNKKVIVVTAHRRENLGKPLEEICLSLKKIAQVNNEVQIIYPVHLNPAVLEVVERILGGISNVLLTKPLNVYDMHNLINKSYMLLTDSGGLQEEAPSLGKPVLVLRNETERPEAVSAGTVRIAGVKQDTIIPMAQMLLNNQKEYDKMAKAVNPYGDGRASERIAKIILYKFGILKDKPEEFYPT